MTTAEHRIKQGASGAVIEDAFPLDPAQNIVGASAQFVFRSPEGETNTVRSASFETEDEAATEITFSRTIGGTDAALDAGVYVYEWKLTLADGTVLIFPESAPTDDYPERKTYTFEILEALSPAEEPSEEEAVIVGTIIQRDTIADMRTLVFSENYSVLLVLSDANGQMGFYEWDATIVTADDDGNQVIALNGGTGGWRRKL